MLSILAHHHLGGLLFLLLVSDSRSRNSLHHLVLLHLLVLVYSHFLLDDLVINSPFDLLEAGCLLSSQSFANDLQSSRLVLRCRLGETLEKLIRKNDSLDVFQPLPDRRRHIVFPEDLVGRVEGGDHMHQPHLVRRVGLVNPGNVQVPGCANLHKLGENDLLQRGLHDRLHPDILSLGAPVLSLEDIEEHDLVHCGAGLLRHVEPVPHGHDVEVCDAHDILGEEELLILLLEAAALTCAFI